MMRTRSRSDKEKMNPTTPIGAMGNPHHMDMLHHQHMLPPPRDGRMGLYPGDYRADDRLGSMEYSHHSHHVNQLPPTPQDVVGKPLLHSEQRAQLNTILLCKC